MREGTPTQRASIASAATISNGLPFLDPAIMSATLLGGTATGVPEPVAVTLSRIHVRR